MPPKDESANALLHLGFHKTGTSAAQQFLSDNHHHLAPRLQIMLMSALIPAEKTARRFSKTRGALDLVAFAAAFHTCLMKFALDPAQPLLLSCEGLAGEIPGRNAVADYSALIELAPIVIGAIASAGYNKRNITLYFGQRDPESWLRSSYVHNLRSTRLTLDYQAYSDTYRKSADLPKMVSKVRDACGNQPVTTSALEEIAQTRFGPATPLLAAFDLPESTLVKLTPPEHVNPSPDATLADRFLALNRGPLPLDALKAEKAGLAA